MVSSPSKILTPLQEEFLENFFEENRDFFLTGGSALSAFYLYHRRSEDLDLFTLEADALRSARNVVPKLADRLKAVCHSVQTFPDFRRYFWERGSETMLVDLAREVVPQIVVKKPDFGNIIVDSLDDILCNKICALVGRAEVKDYIDVFFLDRHGMDIKQYIELARKKDSGVSKATLAFVLSQVSISEVPPYVLKPVSLQELQEFFDKLADQLAVDCFPE
ncbi:nucleotidyl transferase AbiEii/AbiGii toxin family protein [Acidobacteria bacterium AH-259-O06]|nr:nucleotidyl transferase AbiEii/AbiGii toxin family protein [Acidobacteria bacterium AH-259-O06]